MNKKTNLVYEYELLSKPSIKSIIIILIILMFLYVSNSEYFLIGVLLFLSLESIFIPIKILNKIKFKKMNLLKQNGRKAQGHIVEVLYKNNKGNDKSYYLNVVYYDEIKFEEVMITTPKILFSPKKFFSSTDCTVYYDEKNNYVTDFILKEIGQEEIEIKEKETKKLDIYTIQLYAINVVIIILMSIYFMIKIKS